MPTSASHKGWRTDNDDNLYMTYNGVDSLEVEANTLIVPSGSTIDFDAAVASDATLLRDVNDNEILQTQSVASAVNQFAIRNSATGNPVVLAAEGGDTNIDINLEVKGNGHVLVPNAGEGIRLGGTAAFATTQPTNALTFIAGTAPAGAITNGGGVFASTTVVRKIIADGTVSNVET